MADLLQRNTNRFFKRNTAAQPGPSNSANFQRPIPAPRSAPATLANPHTTAPPVPHWEPNPAPIHREATALDASDPRDNQGFWQRMLEFCQQKLGGKS